MKLSTQVCYAIRVLFALRGLHDPISTAVLAERMDVSLQSLERVQAGLKQYGITGGVVGAKGGITLSRPLEEISLGLLITIFEQGVQLGVCHGRQGSRCSNIAECPSVSAWQGVSAKIQKELDNMFLSEIFQADSGYDCRFK